MTKGTTMGTFDSIHPSDARQASFLLASVLGDGYTACDVGPKFTCGEVDRLARALVMLDQSKAATSLVWGHADDDDEGDSHHAVADEDAAAAYVLALA